MKWGVIFGKIKALPVLVEGLLRGNLFPADGAEISLKSLILLWFSCGPCELVVKKVSHGKTGKLFTVF